MLHTPLFSPKFLTDAAKASSQELADLQEHALPIVREWQESLRSGALAATKEEQLQTDFLEAFFAKILGYESSRGAAVWNLEKEQKNVTDSQKADGALGFFSMNNGVKTSDIRAVVELKGAKSDLDKAQNRKEDKRSPVEQAFAYGSKTGGKCRWVIVSNVVEIRLYHVTDQSRYERFELRTLHESEQLRRFLFLLHRARLLNATNPNEKSELDALHEQRKEQERTISAEFYGKYKAARIQLVEHLKAHNPSHDELLLLQKAQKLLDRLLFVFFCEDLNLLPRQTAHKVVQNAKGSFAAREGVIWRELQGLFTAIDKGHPPLGISKFNGGLFAPDAEMDALTVSDSMIESLLQFSEYDFDSDLNVRILGHIFEQSVSDIEELKATITGTAHDTKTGKRKRDGIFYTPEYITRFIVQSTVGAYLEERKQECGFGALPELTDDDFASISISKGVLKANKRIEQHIAAWSAYREHVRTVRVCDPACGSGAFLIEVFDFLYAEGQRVNAELSRLRGGQTEVFDLEKHILTRNIFGVDVNAEAVEITKLSLWLKTANKGKELTDLDGNIKCGNSLVDDPRVAGEAAFDWTVQFASVMEQGGFDVIVGNPPYAVFSGEKERAYFTAHYSTAQYQLDLYILFIEQCVKLLSASGFVGLITPNSWLKNMMMSECRKFLLEHLHFNFIIPNLSNVFPDASVDTLIFTAIKAERSNEAVIMQLHEGNFVQKHSINQQRFAANNKHVFDVELSGDALAFVEKIRSQSQQLENFCDISFGFRAYDAYTGQDKAIIQSAAYHADYKKHDSFVPEIRGFHVNRYGYEWDGKHYISWGSWLAAPREERFFMGERIVFREILGSTFVCTLVSEELKIDRSLYIAVPKIDSSLSTKYILSLLASKVLAAYFRYVKNEFDEVFPKIRLTEFKELPIKFVSEAEQQPFITHAETMLTTTRSLADLRKRVLTLLCTETGITKPSTKLQAWDTLTWAELEAELKKAKVQLSLDKKEEVLTYFEKKQKEAAALKATLEATDRAIDALVYGLYDLTAEEIRVVEGR